MNFWGHPKLDMISIDSVERLSEIYKYDVETSILHATLLLELSHGEDHVNGPCPV